jgi:hypothetical protein
VLGRACVALIAVVALTWLGVMLRDAHLQSRAIREAGLASQSQNFARAAADFRGARLVNPDTTPDLGRAVLLQAAGRRRRAAALLRGVVGREPDNFTAWGVLLDVTRGHDPATARRATAALRRLDPLGARRR